MIAMALGCRMAQPDEIDVIAAHLINMPMLENGHVCRSDERGQHEAYQQ